MTEKRLKYLEDKHNAIIEFCELRIQLEQYKRPLRNNIIINGEITEGELIYEIDFNAVPYELAKKIQTSKDIILERK